MGAFLGVFFHAIGGFAAASFYTPFKKVKNWAWESYWIVGGFSSWIFVPWMVGFITVPGLILVLSDSPTNSLFYTYIFGVLWGIGGLTFGLSMRYLGLSLGYAIALGFTAAFGTVIPPIFDGTFLGLLQSPDGKIVMSGVLVGLVGIAICGKAGILKEKELSEAQKKTAISEFNLKKGLLVAIVSGVLSSCMAFGLAAGKPIALVAVQQGTGNLWQNSPVLIVVLLGGFTTNFLWCMFLNMRNKTFSDYTNQNIKGLGKNYLFSSLAGTIWYFQFMFYGMGTTLMGKYEFASWTIHMSLIILFSNIWGIYFKEWSGVSTKTRSTLIVGLLVIIFSTVLIGLGGYLQ